jgi:predicted ABC-type exoprotein transport system permease subunit
MRLRKPNTALRMAWIIPNVFMYLLFIGFGAFVLINADGLRDINRLGIWSFMLCLLLLVALFGSYRIRTWIKQGKL